jgi:hypothetical protein
MSGYFALRLLLLFFFFEDELPPPPMPKGSGIGIGIQPNSVGTQSGGATTYAPVVSLFVIGLALAYASRLMLALVVADRLVASRLRKSPVVGSYQRASASTLWYVGSVYWPW